MSLGKLVHFSIPSPAIENAVKFYSQLFGWNFKKMTDTYWLTEDGVGSISLEREPVSGTMPILYFSVSSVEEALSSAVKLGAKTLLNRTDAGDGKSFFATIQDPSGNVIGLWSRA